MANPKKITKAEYDRFWGKYANVARKLSCGHENDAGPSFWFSTAFSPCSGISIKGQYKVDTRYAWHFSKTPCDEFCLEKLPMVSCLIVTDNSSEWSYYHCHHKVGNCPWKKKKV